MCISRILVALDRYLSSCRTDRGVIARKYLMGEYSDYDEDMTHVPEGCIYVEELENEIRSLREALGR